MMVRHMALLVITQLTPYLFCLHAALNKGNGLHEYACVDGKYKN